MSDRKRQLLKFCTDFVFLVSNSHGLKVETCSLAFSLIEMRQFVPPQFPSTVGYRGLVYPVVPAGDATKMRPVAASKWVILARH